MVTLKDIMQTVESLSNEICRDYVRIKKTLEKLIVGRKIFLKTEKFIIHIHV